MALGVADFEEMISRAQTTYLAQVGVSLTVASNRINQFLGKLSALAGLLLLMSFIPSTALFVPDIIDSNSQNALIGIFSVNIRIPGQDVDDLSWFFGILGVMIVIALASL